MRKVLLLGLVFLAGGIAVNRLLRGESRQRLARLPARLMEHCMEMMPESSPPKVVMASLRRMQEQNEQLTALVQEQNELLRKRLPGRDASS